MKPIHYLRGDATSPQSKGTVIIAHVSNDEGGWGKGFVVALSRRWKQPETEFRAWAKARETNDFGLGATQFVQCEKDVWVANMVGQHGIRRKGDTGPQPVRYDAIEKCLQDVAAKALELGAGVHMPRIGCGLAGGKWEKIEPMILAQLCERDVEVWVYDWD